ncbi:FMN-dependent NADH-azoreductase 2 [[Clostridium] cellulosi]|uniref:FMN dependent NADH:quinone oxidoreductase n=1 Tax=[Clostridium] cellulosi TaxID=29343 RepID=A0A078KMX7_9FIRM|nr:FMN-dependent NADH-azoreductase 2 [[Clostridium] cellulosi]
MNTVLYIKANPKPDDVSRTFRIANQFIEAYKLKNRDDNIVTLDLYKEGINFLSPQDVKKHVAKPGEGKDDPVLKYAYQFLAADKYVFAEPLWNLGVPAILKAYIDYICVTNITFKYTANGPVGLCQGKKAVNITARGGEYSTGPNAAWELGDKYLKTILGFLGITDYTTIAANSLDIVGVDTETIISKAISDARRIAETF